MLIFAFIECHQNAERKLECSELKFKLILQIEIKMCANLKGITAIKIAFS